MTPTQSPQATPPTPIVNRRKLLGGGGLAAAAVAVATALHAEDAEAFFTPTASEKAARYHETAHVKKFYELNAR